MSREIKFRAWNGSMLYKASLLDEHGYAYENWRDYEDGTPKSNILMQYTGVKDKNGKEIYEGDILTNGRKHTQKMHLQAFKVHYRDDLPGTVCINDQPIYWDGQKIEIDKLEVIGNIYENPELLK